MAGLLEKSLKWIFMLAMGIASVTLLAAEATPDNQTEDLAVSEQDTQELVDPDSGIGDAVDEAPEEESPSRFIPTEQISQDLGVSFPADI